MLKWMIFLGAFLIAAATIVVVPVAVRGTPAPPPPYCPLGICEQDAAKLPPEKRAFWDRAKQQHDEAVAKPIPTGDNPNNIRMTPGPTAAWVTGIFSGNYPPYTQSKYGFQNDWQGPVNGEPVRVYAGFLSHDRTQGLVVVERYSVDRKLLSKQVYLTTTKAGSIPIAKAVGTQLTLVSRGGDTWTFDAADPAGSEGLKDADTPLVLATLQLDLDPTTPGVQSSLVAKDAQDVSIDIVLGENAGNVSAFDVKLIYDDTKLTSLGDGKGGLDGNPAFNDIALGSGWDCSLAGSPSADSDPETGEGHGIALLSCFATGAGASVTSPTVIATLHLHAASAVSASIALSDVHLAHDDGSEIGSCNPVLQVELTCTGGTLSAQ